MKLRSVSVFLLSSVMGAVWATPNTTPVAASEAASASNVLYISGSGSSALNGVLNVVLKQGCTSGSFVSFSDSSALYHAYSCRLAATNDWGLAENTVVTINKRDDGDSIYGVYPVANNTSISFLNLASCPTNATCALASHAPDAGVSDMEPSIYNAPFNRSGSPFASSAAVSSSSFASIALTYPDGTSSPSVVSTLFSQLFGVAVTNKLYTALQTAQSTTGVPSLSRPFLVNYFSQNIGSIGYLPLKVVNADAGINVCYLSSGSGARVAANAFFLNYPGDAVTGQMPLDANASPAPITSPSDAPGAVYINEAVSTQGVKNCLHDVNALPIGYGLALLRKDVPEVPSDFRYIAIDRIEPIRDAAKNGDYDFWMEASIQVNKSSTASAAAKAFLAKFIVKAQSSTILNQLDTATQAGVFALPYGQSIVPADDCYNYAGTYPQGVGSTPADKFCSRFSKFGDSKVLSTFAK